MERVNIVETNLEFGELLEREYTDAIVIHHTGNPTDDDLSAEEIHQSHLNQGWVGIGYHFVIRKDGTIERGRPEWAIGSHAYGENSHTIGIHVCGNFEIGAPTEIQLGKLAHLIGNLCADYDIPTDRAHIVGHRELMPTACPGKNLFSHIDDIVGNANWYRYGAEKTSQTQNNEIPEVKIWNFFKSKKLNDYAVAGIMGNLYAESGLISNNLQNSYEILGSDEEYTAKVDSGEYSKETFVNDGAGYGLAQWTYFARKAALYDFAKQKGASIGDLDMQLEFLWAELLDSYVSLVNALMDAQSVKQASDAFLLDFERPADQSEGQKARRAGYSQEFYEDYAGKAGDANMSEKRYNTVDELPDWAKWTIERMIEQGIINGDGAGLDLSKDMLRTFVIVERMLRR
ncbi:MAG: N-acetylmuramoyl-L-alanine amidase [Selenomonadaceae bacterium]|nr:N-acetylmuramoyl-L-alanine amidase [Selenomonadaceae bacterium]MBO6304198.1 N-acetylmuramoyl-L-alanine amidase [Selenomonadaceae bacterium]